MTRLLHKEGYGGPVTVQIATVCCRICGGVLGSCPANEVRDRPAHAHCDVMFTLEHLVPVWPDDPAHQRELARWRDGWPELGWDERWRSTHPERVRREASTLETPLSLSSMAVRAQGRPNRRVEEDLPMSIYAEGNWVVWCRDSGCGFYRQVQVFADIEPLMREHVREKPGHSFSYGRATGGPPTRPPGRHGEASA